MNNMSIDLLNFTPYHALAGGVLIGLAAIILMVSNKTIMGISGIAKTAMTGPNRSWRVLFIVSIIAAAYIYSNFIDVEFTPVISASPTLLMIGGLTVGLGTSIGNGCTSGHGVCGISRFSMRSTTAVIIFMVTAMITTYLMK